jgi:hypothetical protein
MKNRLLLLCVAVVAIAQNIAAGDEKNGGKSTVSVRIPRLHDAKQTVTPDTYVPEFGYYFTPKASEENTILGPCAPCVCMQICNKKNDECLYVHQSHLNDPQEPLKKVQKHFTAPKEGERLELEATLFTNADPEAMKNFTFGEGDHKKRIENLVKKLGEGTDTKATIFYDEVSLTQDNKHGVRSRTVMFKNKKAHRVNLHKQEGVKDLDAGKDGRTELYLDLKLREKFGEKVYLSKPDSIWRTRENPLFQITHPNMTQINQLPPSIEHPIERHFNYHMIKKPSMVSAITTAEKLVKHITL